MAAKVKKDKMNVKGKLFNIGFGMHKTGCQITI